MTAACTRRVAPNWQAHREHLYQRLNRAGVDHAGVTLWLSPMAALNGVFAPGMVTVLPVAAWLVFVPAVWLQLVYAYAVRRRDHGGS